MAQRTTTQHPPTSLSPFFLVLYQLADGIPAAKPAFGRSSRNTRPLDYVFFLLVLFSSTLSIRQDPELVWVDRICV